ncbi:hypothetical protein Tco_0267895 [Tanacetum coccineum]
MISCTNKGKSLALPWGRTPRLDSGVRVRNHVVRSQRWFRIPDVVHPELPSRNDRIRNSPACYLLLRPPRFVKELELSFFWVDASIFPLAVLWHNNKTLRKDPHPTPAEFNTDVYNFLADNHALFKKFLEPFLCFVIKMGLFTFIHHADPTKVKIGEREVRDGEVLLLELTRGGGDATEADQTEQSDHLVQFGRIDIMADDKAQALVADQPKKLRKKMKAADGASGSGLPPKKLREDHDASEITNVAGDEVTSVVRSLVPEPPIMTTAVAITVVADTSALVPRTCPRLVPRSIFRVLPLQARPTKIPQTLQQMYVPKWTAINDSALDYPDVCRSVVDHLAPQLLFCHLCSMDYEQLLTEFNVGAARQTCLSSEVAKMTHDLSNLQLSCDELSVKASSLEFEKDKLFDQVSALETTCSDLRNEVMGYKLFKEQIKADGLVTDIDHEKVRRVLAEVAAYNPVTEANYVAAFNALRPAAETLEASQLQPSPDQLMLPIHRLEDQVVIGETSLSFSLDLAHARVWKLKEGAASRRLSISDALVPIVEPLSVENLVGEASTLGVPAAVATTTALSTTFAKAGSVPPIPQTKAPPSSSIVFEKE